MYQPHKTYPGNNRFQDYLERRLTDLHYFGFPCFGKIKHSVLLFIISIFFMSLLPFVHIGKCLFLCHFLSKLAQNFLMSVFYDLHFILFKFSQLVNIYISVLSASKDYLNKHLITFNAFTLCLNTGVSQKFWNILVFISLWHIYHVTEAVNVMVGIHCG